MGFLWFLLECMIFFGKLFIGGILWMGLLLVLATAIGGILDGFARYKQENNL